MRAVDSRTRRGPPPSLNHPNIVAVHDCGEHGGAPFIVMERLPGRTLADEIAVGPMPPRRVRATLDDVLGALATAHAAGIVHRDVKPGNVLLTQNGGAMKVGRLRYRQDHRSRPYDGWADRRDDGVHES